MAGVEWVSPTTSWHDPSSGYGCRFHDSFHFRASRDGGGSSAVHRQDVEIVYEDWRDVAALVLLVTLSSGIL